MVLVDLLGNDIQDLYEQLKVESMSQVIKEGLPFVNRFKAFDARLLPMGNYWYGLTRFIEIDSLRNRYPGRAV